MSTKSGFWRELLSELQSLFVAFLCVGVFTAASCGLLVGLLWVAEWHLYVGVPLVVLVGFTLPVALRGKAQTDGAH